MPTAATAPVAAEPQISHPIPSEARDASALPALNDSDQLAHDSLAGVIGRDPVEQFIIPQNIIRHMVVTVDNLPRQKVAVDLRPVKPTPGATVVATQGEIITLSAENYAALRAPDARRRRRGPQGAGAWCTSTSIRCSSSRTRTSATRASTSTTAWSR